MLGVISNLIYKVALIGIVFRRRIFRARRRGGRSFGRRRRAKPTINHYESTITQTTGGTEQSNTAITGVDDVSNRSTHVPDGAIITKVDVRLRCQDIQPGDHKALLFLSPGGLGITTPIASYYSVTDPLPEDAILIRRYKLNGPYVRRQVTGANQPITFHLKWKGRIRYRDGDDIVIQTNFPDTNQVTDTSVTYVFYGG